MAKIKGWLDIDMETRSEADIRKAGAYVYAEHSSTEILLMRYSINKGEIHGWRIGDPFPKRLKKALAKGYLIRAHNSFFEYCIWRFVGHAKLGWPEVAIEQFYCTMAMACTYSYQPSLEAAGEEMHLPVKKDKEGKRLIQKFSKPSRKKDGPLWNQPDAFPEEFDSFDDYCTDDVRVQQGIVDTLPILSEKEHQVFLLTEVMNVRGVPIDVPMVKGAIKIIGEFLTRANKEAQKITQNAFKSLTQTAKVKAWLNANGCNIPDMQKATIERKLKQKKGMPKKARRLLELRYQAAKSSTAKYYAAIDKLGKDQAVHETLKYHIAQTGRWGGRGLQVHNFVRPNMPKNTDYSFLCEVIAAGDIDYLEMTYGDVMQALASAIRSMIKAPPKMKLIAADYSQIEARIVFWYAKEWDAIEMFRQKKDIYCDLASDIYGRTITKENDFERFIGKTGILGLGFGMGDKKFKQDLWEKADVTIETAFGKKIVKMYRNKYKKVVKAWTDVESAAIEAVENPGRKVYCLSKKVYYQYNDDILDCCLPSGRKIHYVEPRVKNELPRWGGNKLMKKLSYMGTSSVGNKWCSQYTYGGKLFNNIVQGTARDVMIEGMLYAESKGYTQLFTVHDESIAVVPKTFGSVEEYEKILVHREKWASTIPVVAEGWQGERYRK